MTKLDNFAKHDKFEQHDKYDKCDKVDKFGKCYKCDKHDNCVTTSPGNGDNSSNVRQNVTSVTKHE